jgi:hypothetical protein
MGAIARRAGANREVKSMRRAIGVVAAVTLATCTTKPTSTESGSAALPDLNKVESCTKSDLGRYWGSTYRFHRDGCWAQVTFDERGKVLSFEPEDAQLCKRVLATC